METRANYLLVGGFVLLMVAGLAGFVIWLAKFQFDTAFETFDIRFTGTVTGLAEGGPVRFRGVRVGEVSAIEIDPEDPGKVVVTIVIEATTPVREDTRASLEIEGLTGARYVLLIGGSADAAALAPEAGRTRAEIPSVPSSLEQIIEGAPELVVGANLLFARANALLSEENRASFRATLVSLERISEALAEQSGNLGSLIEQTNATMANLNRASGSFDVLLVQVREDSHRLATRADGALIAVEALAASLDESVAGTTDEVGKLIKDLRGSARSFSSMTKEIQDLVAETRGPLRDFTYGGLYELNTLLIEARALLAGLNRVTTEVERGPARFLFGNQQEGYETGR